MSAPTHSPNRGSEVVNDAVGMWLQIGFVEGIARDSRSFRSLEKALRHAFQHNRESAIILWNDIPVQMDYTDDIPAIISPLIGLVHALQNNEVLRNHEVSFASTNLSTTWFVDADHKHIALCAEWHRVRGNYQNALNGFSTTTIEKDSFLNEWKLLFGQCKQAIMDSGSEFSSAKAKEEFSVLCSVEENILSRGRYYVNNE